MQLKHAAIATLASLATLFNAGCNKPSTPDTALESQTPTTYTSAWNDSTFVGTATTLPGPPWRGDGAVLTYRNPR